MTETNKKVFKDLKIAAFSWAMVGPLTLKFFARAMDAAPCFAVAIRFSSRLA